LSQLRRYVERLLVVRAVSETPDMRGDHGAGARVGPEADTIALDEPARTSLIPWRCHDVVAQREGARWTDTENKWQRRLFEDDKR